MGDDFHSLKSVLRERIVEHGFIADMWRMLWQRGIHDVEVLRSEFDAGGYDIVIGRGALVRHVQFKCKLATAKTAKVNISRSLENKPSGCVIWTVINPDLTVDHYLWLGGPPFSPLSTLEDYKTARHTKGDSTGHKAEKPNMKAVPIKAFERLVTLEAVVERLLGPF